MRKIAILLSIITLLLSPFWITALANNYQLWKFSRQLVKVENLLPENYVVLADGSDIYIGGNGEYCSYRATQVYRIIAKQETLESLKEEIENLAFSPAQKSENNYPAEVNVEVVGLLLIVFITAGPYDAGFDIRCW